MKKNLDSPWKFYRGEPAIPPYSGGYAEAKVAHPVGPAHPDALDSAWRDVSIPHDWSVEENVEPWGRPMQGFFPGGTGWYRTKFNLPPGCENKKTFLTFEGVSRKATVWVNGFLLGTHDSGYTANILDITDFVPRSLFREGEQVVPDYSIPEVIVVHVDCSETEGWWYEGCGIYRPVTLDIVDKLHFVPDGIFQHVQMDSAHEANVIVEAETINEYTENITCTVRSTILDSTGNKVASHETTVTIPAGQTAKPIITLKVPSPHLWSPETPYLYLVRTQIIKNKECIEVYEHTCGMRWFSFDPAKGFFLNGAPHKICGANGHQDFAGVGIALPTRLHGKKIELLKEMGCNAYRCSHHPPGQLLDECDRLGMLVMDENRKLDSSPDGIADLVSMIRHDRNHPSIFIWSLFNEEFLHTRKLGTNSVRTLARIAKEHDPSRLNTAALCFGKNVVIVEEFWRALDVAGRNYSPDCYVADHEKYPDQIMIATEFAMTPTVRGLYHNKNSYVSWYDVEKPSKDPSPYEAAWRPIAENSFMTGGFMWAGIDYRGEPTPSQWPNIVCQYGVMDLCGFPKDGYFYYKSWWKQHEPLVHIMPHWTWPGKEGQSINVRCFSNCDTIQLFVNNRALDVQTMPHLGHVAWDVPYEPGTLRAVGYKNGKQAAVADVATAGAPSSMHLAVDRNTISADGQDVVCVAVSVLDKKGILVPYANNDIEFSVSGPAKLIGLGNGDPQCHVPEKADHRPAFGGRCMAIVQAGTIAGTITVTARSQNLPNATIRIDINK